MTAQPKETPAIDSKEALIFGISDRLFDHGHAITNVVLAPALPDGSPDWEHAVPANLEPLPADEWPDDPATANRAGVLVDAIDGCDVATSMLVFFDRHDGPTMLQISGPDTDGDIAMRIIARDIGARPPESPVRPIQEQVAQLTADLAAWKTTPVAANENRRSASPAAKLASRTLPIICPAEWQGKVVPAREWYAADLIPNRQVTIVTGDGGVGKSLFTLQVAAAGSLGVETAGINPTHGRVVYVGAEDEADEFHRRLSDIVVAHGRTLGDLTDFRLVSLADQDALLARPDVRGNMAPTELYVNLAELVGEFGPKLLVLDTAADLFGGDEIKRGQVRQFIGMLRTIAIAGDCAVVLLTHPSVAGMQSGSGSSGSTAWNNSVRSRLYLTRPDGKEADPDLRYLTTKKSNYGAIGSETKLRWENGCFVLDTGSTSSTLGIMNKKANQVFIRLLRTFARTGQNVGASPGTNYAPAKMAKHTDADGLSKKALEGAMQRLLEDGTIKLIWDGPPSKQRQRLIVSADDYGARSDPE